MGGWLTAAELEDYRGAIEAGFDQSAVIWRRADAPDPWGGVTATYSAAGTVSCRVDWLSQPREIAVADRPTTVCQYLLAVPWDTTLAATDRVVVGTVTMDVVLPASLRSEAFYQTAFCTTVEVA